MINLAKVLCAGALALAGASLGGCATATSEAMVPFDVMINGTDPQRVTLVVEESGVLPIRSADDSVGAGFEQVDLATNHNVMVGFNEAYLMSYQLAVDGSDWKSGDGLATRSTYDINSAPGAFDYALTSYYRSNRYALDNECYYENALVFGLKPGVVNYIPKELQRPLYHGQPAPAASSLDLTGVRKVLAGHPIGALEIAIPDVVAVVKFARDGLAIPALPGQDCAYSNDFTILQRFDTPGVTPAH